MRELSSKKQYGIIITNPLYGERLMSDRDVERLYRDFGAVYRKLDKWCAYVITSYRGFEKHFGSRADKIRKLYNSQLE